MRNDPLRCLSYMITAPMFWLVEGIYRPIGTSAWLARLRKYLFYCDYLYFLGNFTCHEQALSVFDHLVPVLTAYISREGFAR